MPAAFVNNHEAAVTDGAKAVQLHLLHTNSGAALQDFVGSEPALVPESTRTGGSIKQLKLALWGIGRMGVLINNVCHLDRIYVQR